MIAAINPDIIRASLQEFWGEVLEIASSPAGLTLAMPISQPDGWQIAIDVQPLTPGVVRLSDKGRTLQWLAGEGQNIAAERVSTLLQERMQTFDLKRDGWELYRTMRLPFEARELHLFAEGLASVAHLTFLHQPSGRVEDVVEKTIERIFEDRRLPFQRNHLLIGAIERKVKVDYYVELREPVAIQLIRQQGSVVALMEQWGYRWYDLKKVRPQLAPVMVYNPDLTDIDPAVRSIGESVCSLFCAYYEADRIHQFLGQMGAVA